MKIFTFASLASLAIFLAAPVSAQSGPTPFREACPEAQLDAGKQQKLSSLDLYEDSRRAYSAWQCAYSMSLTLPERELTLEETQEQYDEWVDLRKKLHKMESELYARSRRWYSNPPDNYRALYNSILYGSGTSLTSLDRTGIHSSPGNLNDPLRNHPAYKRALLRVTGKENYNAILDWESKSPPLYQTQDQKDPVREAKWATEVVINRVWNNRPNLYPGGTGIRYARHGGSQNTNWQGRHAFSCEFWGKRWETYHVEVVSGESTRIEERTRCTEADWAGAPDFLEVFKKERDLACEMVHPKHDNLDKPHLLPRCSHPERLERQAVRENLLPQSDYNRKYGQDAIAEAQAWYDQAKAAKDALAHRQQVFEKIVLQASGDARVARLVGKYRALRLASK